MNIKSYILKSPVCPHYIARNSLEKKIEQYAKLVKGGTLIDIGCGEKPYEKYFDVEKYIGIEIEGGSHERSKKNANIFYDGKRLPFEDESVSWVLCTQVLEHMAEPEAFIRECSRVLKNEGGIILSAPQVWGLHEEPFDFYRFTKYGLKYLIEKCGFEVIRSDKTTGIWGTVGQRLAADLFYRYGVNKLFKLIVAVIICMPLQLVCMFLDYLGNYKGDTLDNIVFAKKKK